MLSQAVVLYSFVCRMIQVNPATATSRQASGLNEDVIQAKASDMFKPIITFMKVCGTYSERGNPQKCKLCSYHFGYCIVINVVVILFGFKYFSVFRKGYDNTYKMVGLVTFAYFYCCVSCFCVIYLFHNCKYLTVIMTAFDKYGMDYGTCLNISVFNKRMKILIIIISGLLLFMIVCAMPVFVLYEEHQMLAKSHLAPFDESTGLIYYIAGFLNSLYSMENYCILISNSVFQLTFLHIIKNEFSSIAKEVKKNVFIQDFDRLFSLRRHHESLCELINIGNPILQQNAAFLYVYGIPIICLMLYGVTTGSVDMVDVLTMSMFIGLSVIEVFVVTIMGAQLCESVNIYPILVLEFLFDIHVI